VFWPGHIVLPDNLHADAIVVFRHKEVTVYPDESTKPPVGQGLNRHAEITLERVWPVDKATRKIVADVATLSRMQVSDGGTRMRAYTRTVVP
jgi:nuclear pore complex protein Nup98-Nup96